MSPSDSPLRYVARKPGTNAAGAGALGETSAHLAERLYEDGWRSARITDSTGREVGGISTTRENGRTWWGEGE